jgi:hypothetical protein
LLPQPGKPLREIVCRSGLDSDSTRPGPQPTSFLAWLLGLAIILAGASQAIYPHDNRRCLGAAWTTRFYLNRHPLAVSLPDIVAYVQEMPLKLQRPRDIRLRDHLTREPEDTSKSNTLLLSVAQPPLYCRRPDQLPRRSYDAWRSIPAPGRRA